MDNVRILKGYSKTERKELEDAKDNGFNSAFDVIYGIIKSEGDLAFIVKKYDEGSSSDNDQLAKDIVDYYAGVAKFAEPKKYYVHFIKGDECSYLNITLEDGHRVALLSNNLEFSCWQKTKFTRDEVIAIDPKFVPFMEEVEK
ncbi:hypothetical protein ACROUK_01270 [Companilactobacillus alimentarius]|uniref:hypothetical protein n=1 Tax=Companilactobacillus alimentarius TaxID=1602 RepID=UPI003D7DBD71